MSEKLEISKDDFIQQLTGYFRHHTGDKAMIMPARRGQEIIIDGFSFAFYPADIFDAMIRANQPSPCQCNDEVCVHTKDNPWDGN